MSSVNTISLTEVDKKFSPKARGVREIEIQTSFSNADKAQGRLRMEGVDNARYGKKHPILTKNGELAGAIKDGFSSVGYTYSLLYSDVAEALVITHSYFRSLKDCLSFLESDGRFGLFDSTPKFVPHNTVVLGSNWIGNMEGFMFLGKGKRLLVVSTKGLATIDMRERTLVGQMEFEHFAYDLPCDLSPLVDNIAIAECNYVGDDAVTGEHRYENVLRIYNAYECTLLSETKLKTAKQHAWRLRFSSCGRYLNASSNDENVTFEMK